MPKLCVIGLSHRTAPIDVREQVAYTDDKLTETLRTARDHGVKEVMIISTCNRVEFYAGLEEDVSPQVLERLFLEIRQLPTSLRGQLYLLERQEALRHLFRVASSLDSMVVGEPQILGQVKDAYALAMEAGAVGAVLGQVVPRAFAAAKRVRAETDIAKNASSVASVAVELAKQIFGDLGKHHVLVVGAGKMGELSAKHLRTAGIQRMTVINRTEVRGQELAQQLGAEAAPWAELEALLALTDIVVCSTGAVRPVISAELVQRVMRARKGRWLFFIDIAVPRDVEPSVGKTENVYLYDVDELGQVLEQHRTERTRAAAEGERLVEEELQKFSVAERVQGMVPLIKLLRVHFTSVAHGEAERTLAKLNTLGERDKEQVLRMGEAIINKLLHAPLTALKGPESEALAEALRVLFDLDAVAEREDKERKSEESR